MKPYLRYLLLAFFAAFLIGCRPTALANSQDPTTTLPTATATSTSTEIPSAIQEEAAVTPTQSVIEETPQPTPTPDPFASLYNCEMEIQFMTGPLSERAAEFTVLGEDYFFDKGDKFAVGKGTSIYYEAQKYFILHSSFVNGNPLRPMEAEFIRKYLEYWGTADTDYIQEKITELVGSEALWVCDGQAMFKTRINGAVRLSHEASDRLWLEPEELETILDDKEGLVSEWVGEIPETDDQSLYIGFCGWGPSDLGSKRYTYFRYLINFEILD